MNWGKILISAAIPLSAASPVAAADAAKISGLSDVSFGSIVSAVDQTRSQNVVVCSYKNNPQNLPYSVRASGSGTANAFQLSSGAASLAFEVQWSASPGQVGGTQLQPATSATGFANGANGFDCPTQGSNASLTIIIRSADIAVAPAGTYTGTLQLMIAPQ